MSPYVLSAKGGGGGERVYITLLPPPLSSVVVVVVGRTEEEDATTTATTASTPIKREKSGDVDTKGRKEGIQKKEAQEHEGGGDKKEIRTKRRLAMLIGGFGVVSDGLEFEGEGGFVLLFAELLLVVEADGGAVLREDGDDVAAAARNGNALVHQVRRKDDGPALLRLHREGLRHFPRRRRRRGHQRAERSGTSTSGRRRRRR
mmetsp:Transcript_9855/g.29843  ORF Transcript_9855/g.29843 Transcript_9855/m.29843 type:complete len:203 (-) Transcript_9855:788-1396(-)